MRKLAAKFHWHGDLIRMERTHFLSHPLDYSLPFPTPKPTLIEQRRISIASGQSQGICTCKRQGRVAKAGPVPSGSASCMQDTQTKENFTEGFGVTRRIKGKAKPWCLGSKT